MDKLKEVSLGSSEVNYERFPRPPPPPAFTSRPARPAPQAASGLLVRLVALLIAVGLISVSFYGINRLYRYHYDSSNYESRLNELTEQLKRDLSVHFWDSNDASDVSTSNEDVDSTPLDDKQESLADVTILSFSWSNCGGDSDPIKVSNVVLTPDPVQLPGNISISMGLDVANTLNSPAPFSTTIWKKSRFGWIKFPCIDNIGSCSFDDWCVKIKDFLKPCPPELDKLGLCTCPYKAGHYDIPLTQLFSISKGIPAMFATGDYRMAIDLSDATKTRQVCLQLEAQVVRAG